VRSAPALADDIEEVQRQLGVSVARAPEGGGKSGSVVSTSSTTDGRGSTTDVDEDTDKEGRP
jgi:NADH-quinone oxidoreductase subunit J